MAPLRERSRGDRERSRGGAVDPRLLRRARATRGYLVAGIAVGTVTAAVIVGQAWLLATAIAGTFARRDLSAVTATIWPLVGVFVARGLLSWLNSVLAQRSAAAVKSQLRTEIMAARLRQPGAAGPDGGTLDGAGLVAVLTQGLDALDGYVGRYLPQLVLAATVPLVVGVAILTADWVSAVVVALTLPLIPLFMVLVGWLTQTRVRRRAAVQQRLAHHFADLVAGLPTLQVFGRAKAQAEGLRRTGEAHRRETMATLRVSFLSALVLELLATLSVAIVAVGIGLRVVDGNLTLMIGLFVLILAPEAYLPERAFDLIDAAPPATGTRGVPDLTSAVIEVDGVGVTYPGAAAPALRDVRLLLGPGEIVAIGGDSGAGKSTLVAVLLGFLEPSAGRVLVGGVPLDELDPVAWRASLAWVPQQPGLVAGTIADNVRLGAPEAPAVRVRSALRRAGAGELDPERVLAAGGEGLSAGEVRRVALARALLRIDCAGGELLVLDEPTAGLDADAELVVLDELRRLGVGALVVSHRPAVLAAADRVVELHPGVPRTAGSTR
jgi:ABC-type transport system involved in cytochrome bd biosynthesis fused ATPase/permease subunit